MQATKRPTQNTHGSLQAQLLSASELFLQACLAAKSAACALFGAFFILQKAVWQQTIQSVSPVPDAFHMFAESVHGFLATLWGFGVSSALLAAGLSKLSLILLRVAVCLALHVMLLAAVLYPVLRLTAFSRRMPQPLQQMQQLSSYRLHSLYQVLTRRNWLLSHVRPLWLRFVEMAAVRRLSAWAESGVMFSAKTLGLVHSCPVCLNMVCCWNTFVKETCSHRLCKTCFVPYLQSQLDQARGRVPRCMVIGCNSAVCPRQCQSILKHHKPVSLGFFHAALHSSFHANMTMP